MKSNFVLNRFYSSGPAIVLILFLLIPFKLRAQVRFSASHESGTYRSSQVVKLRLGHFVNLISAQGTVHYDTAQLKFLGFQDYNTSIGLNSSNFGLPSAGNITFSWNDANLTGVTLPDSTEFVGLRFLLKGPVGSVSPVTLPNSPTPYEFANNQFQTTGFVLIPGSVTVLAGGIVTGTLTQSSFCAGDGLQIPFVASGTYGAGNVFTAQLSDSSGSFANPLVLGTGVSPITGIIPNSVIQGSKYRIRVLASSPFEEGADNGSDIGIYHKPVINITGPGNICLGSCGFFSLRGASNYAWFPSTRVNFIQPDSFSVCPTTTTRYKIIGTNWGGCTDSIFYTVQVNPIPVLRLQVASDSGRQGDSIEIPIRAFGWTKLSNISVALNWDSTKLALLGPGQFNLPGSNAANLNTLLAHSGLATFSWTNANHSAITIPDSSILFSLRFKLTGPFGSISRISPYAQFITDSGSCGFKLKLDTGFIRIKQPQTVLPYSASSFQVWQNAPNPFSGSTEIGFYLPRPGAVNFLITNTMGQTVFEESSFYEQGTNYFKWQPNPDLHPGIYFLTIVTKWGTQGLTMVYYGKGG